MDIVYNRAIVTAGLLDVEITSQEQLTAIEALLYPDQRKSAMMDRRFYEQILDFLHRISQDRWYTRAWVIQESIRAGNGLMLVFRRGRGITFESSFRFGREGEDLHPHNSLDDDRGSWESKLICMHLRGFWRILDSIKSVLVPDFVRVGDRAVQTEPRPEVYPGARSILEAADRLHTRTEKANTINQRVRVDNEGFYGHRPTINAAGALTLLKHRECYFNADRLAIIANMCDYDFRLDTKKVNANCHSLRLAILALALSNGDLSLLVPEVYLPDGRENQEDTYAGSASSSTMFQNIFLEANQIEYCQVRDYINIRLQTGRQGQLTAEGMLLHSYLWSVDREIDFSPIQAEWADEWESCKNWVLVYQCQEDEVVGGQAHAHLMALVQRLFNQPDVTSQALKDFRRWGHIPHESSVWGNFDHTRIQVKRGEIDAKHAQQVPAKRETISQIIFAILWYIRYTLAASEEEGELMKGLANSIWHSVRIDQVPGSGYQLPDEVGDTLFTHPDIVNRPSATLQLDEMLDKSLAQLWFIDRIMQHGRLWCGTYTPPKRPAHRTSSPGSHSSTTYEEDLKAHNEHLAATPEHMWSVLNRQFARQCPTAIIEGDVAGNGRMRSTRHNWVTYPEILRMDLWSDRKERLRKRTLLSTFDVGGPCLVATPYDPEREVLPRPKLRSSSTCWVVEAKEDGGSAEGTCAGVEDDFPDVTNSNAADGTEARGKGKERAADVSPEAEPSIDADDVKAKKLLDRRDLDLRVLRKVKGLWCIMDLPSQRYLFS